jgi:hypothetical protein
VSYDHLRTWREDGFRLDLWDTGRTDSIGKTLLRYALFDEEWQRIDPPERRGLIFEGEDFAVGMSTPIDSDAAVGSLLGFLSLRPGDVESEYFEGYTASQIEWRDARAEELSFAALRLEEDEE